MKKLVPFILVLFLFQTKLIGQSDSVRVNRIFESKYFQHNDSNVFLSQNFKPARIEKLEIPETKAEESIINHTGYSLQYNLNFKLSKWVAYELTAEETIRKFERTDKFLVDPKISISTSFDIDYLGSGYDRGHLAPAGDMGWSATSMAESFYYSNMSPQTPAFNRGVWNKLEQLTREWAVENHAIYIVTGPILKSGLQTIGPNKITIPEYFYKVILDYSDPSVKGIGFIIKNTGSKETLRNFAVTIDSVEKFVGINFFPLLPDDQETIIEKTLCLNCWTWKKATLDTQSKVEHSNLCRGTTKAGARCRSFMNGKSGYCNWHKNQGDSKQGSSSISIKPDKQTGTTSKGEPIYTGPRGGKYHFNKNGEKVYEKK